MYRFDIYGLSPDADEDETGIKRASENSMSYIFHCNFVQCGKDGTIRKALPFCLLHIELVYLIKFKCKCFLCFLQS